jgi:hypothetical protein
MGLFDHIEDEGIRNKTQEAHDTALATFKDETTKAVQTQIDEAVSGLKTKNDDLLKEKKTIQDTLKGFDGLDPEKAKEALDFLNGNEDAQLIKDGKIEELIDRRTSTMKSDFETLSTELGTQIKDLTTKKDKYKNQYQNKVIDDTLRDAAAAGKSRPEAVADIILRGKGVFTLAADGTVEARDSEGKLVKIDEKVLTPSNWVESLKTSSPHYWPNSEGADAGSQGFGDGDDLQDRINVAASKGNMSLYRKLKAQQK